MKMNDRSHKGSDAGGFDLYAAILKEARQRLLSHKGLVTPAVVWEAVGSMQLVLQDKLLAMGTASNHNTLQVIVELLAEEMCVESARLETLRPDWIAWNRRQIGLTKVGGHLLMPIRGIAMVRRKTDELMRVAELSFYEGSRTQVINSRCWEHLGFKETKADDRIMDPAAFVSFLSAMPTTGDGVYIDPQLFARLELIAKLKGGGNAAANA